MIAIFEIKGPNEIEEVEMPPLFRAEWREHFTKIEVFKIEEKKRAVLIFNFRPKDIDRAILPEDARLDE